MSPKSPREDRVRIVAEGAIARMTLTRPEKHNGVDVPMLKAVVAAQRRLRKMPEIRAVVLDGEGPSFCSGLDVKSVLGSPRDLVPALAELWSPRRNIFQDWSLGFREIGLPVIAAIHGNCFGAGIQLALGADIRVARPDAKISLLEAKWGLVPDMGGPTLLRELVRIDVAKELTMTGRILSGVEAAQIGLVTHVSDDPLARAREIAAEIATRSPDSVAAGKMLLQEAYAAESEEAALASERRWQRRVLGFANQRIAIARNTKKDDRPFGPRRIAR
jgi:enoyl-CoA hydratase/carnithine racemase